MPTTPRTAPCWKAGPESNIFSIISSGDAVARVLPAAWGYHRNGCDRFLPATRNAEELADLDALGAEFGPHRWWSSSLATAEDTSALINIVAKFCVSRKISTRSTKPPSWT